MSDPSMPAAKTPWHLWVVGILALLWNGFGGYDYVMTQTANAGYFAAMGVTPEMADYFATLPLWHETAWAVGVWGAVLGAVLLLLHSAWAVWAFAASLVGILFGNLLPLLDAGTRAMAGGVGIAFSVIIPVLGVALLLYALAMKKRGVLR